MRRLCAILPLILTSALCAAQSAVDVTQAPVMAQPLLVDQLLHSQTPARPALSNLQATPLWGTPDGRILAIVASADNQLPAKPQRPQIGSAADWKFVDVTNFVTSGLLLNLNRDTAVYATFGRGLLLGPTYAAAWSCSPLVAPALADASCSERTTLARSGAMQLGADWAVLDNLDLDLSYGMAWYHHDYTTPGNSGRAPIDLFGTAGSTTFPTLLIPGLEGSDVQNAGLSALGRWRFDGPTGLDLGASLNHIQLYAPAGSTPLTSLNQAAVTFGLRYGSFSGNVTGHVLGPVDAFNGNSRWAGLDIGLSWRTPWQGQLSVGTQNLWSSGMLPSLNEPGAREVDSNQARVPYVQYHQDL
ncbi:MAG TPA: hypothetical protein VGH81_02730 [Rudaea sp.]|jgi:hypothetical protein